MRFQLRLAAIILFVAAPYIAFLHERLTADPVPDCEGLDDVRDLISRKDRSISECETRMENWIAKENVQAKCETENARLSSQVEELSKLVAQAPSPANSLTCLDPKAPRFLALWRAPLFEDSWLFTMFKGVCFELMHDRLPDKYYSRVLLIANKKPQIDEWLDYVKNKSWVYNAPVNADSGAMDLFHLSDENYNFAFFQRYYKKWVFRNVFRNYWSAHQYGPPYTNAPHVMWLPLGWTPGFGPIPSELIMPASMRRHRTLFLGQTRVSDERQKYVPRWAAIKELEMFSEVSAGFMEGMKIGQYRAYMLNSVFVPNFKGVNDDCYRLYEALEAGCIPIVKRSEKFFNFGVGTEKAQDTAPYIIVEEFEEAEPMIPRLMQNLAELDALQTRIYSWWRDQKVRFQQTFQARLLQDITGEVV